MGLGLGSNLTKGGLTTPAIPTDNLVIKYNFDVNGNIPVSDGAAYFDGANDRIDLGTGLNSTLEGNFTISAWITRLADDTDLTIFSANDGASDGVRFHFNTSNHLHLRLNGVEIDTSGVTFTLNKWYHVVGIYDDDNNLGKIYVNGVEEKSESHDVAVSGISSNAFFGHRSNDSALDYNGYICNVGIWSAVLDQSQIQSIMWKNYTDLRDSEKTNLVSWWNLDTAYDSSVFDNHHGDGDSLSSNLWINSDDVTTGSGWTWDGSVGHAQSDDTDAGDFVQEEVIEGNTVYKTVYTVSDYVKGQVRIKLNSANDSNDYYGTGTTRTSNGTYTEYIKTSSTSGSEFFNHIQFQTYGSTDDNFKVSDIQVYKVNGNTGTLT